MPAAEREEIVRNLSIVDEVVSCIDGDDTVAKTIEMIKPAFLPMAVIVSSLCECA